jgi:cytochrome c peroxidase
MFVSRTSMISSRYFEKRNVVMRKSAIFIAVAATGLTLTACDKKAEVPGKTTTTTESTTTASIAKAPAEPLMASAQALFKVIPAAAPALPGNPATSDKLALGKMLFFEPRLAASHAISCAACHNIGLGGTDTEPTSIGHHWQRGGRNAPTVLNAVFNTAQFWDGRAADLEAQAGGPMVNPIEMASPKDHVVEQIRGIPGYRDAFAKAFPGETDPITMPNAQKAIAVFEAGLLTPDAPFDRYLKGDATALSAPQKQGLKLFIDKGCAACHNGINVGGGMYAKFGVVASPGAAMLPPGDKGRSVVTGATGDAYNFKVPTLRNITLTAPYFHTGSVWDLRQAVAVMGTAQLGAKLTDAEIDGITAFLGSLTGVQPVVTLPILPPSVATTPRPQP